MKSDFTGKVALITGGNSGIGRAVALIFAQRGAKTVIAARGNQEGEETVRAVKDTGHEAIFIEMDVSRAAEVQAMIQKAIETFGRLDFAINNAGVSGRRSVPIGEYSEVEWDHVINTNLKGVWLCMKYEIPELLRNNGGVIVNVSSVVGLKASPVNAVYSASKHGVVGLTRSYALQYARQNLRINAICPGYTDTPMLAGAVPDPKIVAQIAESQPVGRLGTPEEIAEAVVWICSDAASFVTGHCMVVDGGLSL